MFPTIYSIAMDYLPIQASAVPCERVFSSSSETCTKKRNRTSPILLEALQMVKFSLKKERLNFTKGWATSEQNMLNQELCDVDSRNLLGSVGSSTNGVAMDVILHTIATQQGDNTEIFQ
jgi:hypothetical protein